MYYIWSVSPGLVYYIPMTQPKLPPISIRLPADLVTEIEAWALKAGKKRNGAIAELLRLGLGVEAVRTSPPAVEPAVVRLPTGSRPHQSRLKGEWKPK